MGSSADRQLSAAPCLPPTPIVGQRISRYREPSGAYFFSVGSLLFDLTFVRLSHEQCSHDGRALLAVPTKLDLPGTVANGSISSHFVCEFFIHFWAVFCARLGGSWGLLEVHFIDKDRTTLLVTDNNRPRPINVWGGAGRGGEGPRTEVDGRRTTLINTRSAKTRRVTVLGG